MVRYRWHLSRIAVFDRRRASASTGAKEKSRGIEFRG
jgi:hypothetical protein